MNSDYDILIIGGGLVGACLAGLLAADRHLQSLRLGIVEAAPPGEPPDDEIDVRVSAISRASQSILTRAGGWQLLPAKHVSSYTDMVVWDASGEPRGAGSIHFSAAATGGPDLGCIIENRRLHSALYRASPLRERVTVLRTSVTGLAFAADDSRVIVTLADGRRIATRLAVGADGAGSPSRKLAGIGIKARAYDQTAVVTHVRTALPHRRTAWQRFLPDGPLAFLPLADGRSSIVWSTTPEHAGRLTEMPATDFERELLVASDAVLGAVELTAPRARFPLQLMHAEEYCRPGYVLVGDAAHAVHPLAGQGVNLGFADCAALAETLAGAYATDAAGWSDKRVLRRYERRRKSENLLAAGVIDTLKHLFGATDPRLRTLRRLGLQWVDRSAVAKRLLIARATASHS